MERILFFFAICILCVCSQLAPANPRTTRSLDVTKTTRFDILTADSAFRLVAGACAAGTSLLVWWPVHESYPASIDGSWLRYIPPATGNADQQSLLCWYPLTARLDGTYTPRCLTLDVHGKPILVNGAFQLKFLQANAVLHNVLIVTPSTGLNSPATQVYTPVLGRPVRSPEDCAKWAIPLNRLKAYTALVETRTMPYTVATMDTLQEYGILTTLDTSSSEHLVQRREFRHHQ